MVKAEIPGAEIEIEPGVRTGGFAGHSDAWAISIENAGNIRV